MVFSKFSLLIWISSIALCAGNILDELDIDIVTNTVSSILEDKTRLPTKEKVQSSPTDWDWSSFYDNKYKPYSNNLNNEGDDPTFDNSNNERIPLYVDPFKDWNKINYSSIFPKDNNFNYNDIFGNNHKPSSYDFTPEYTYKDTSSSYKGAYFPVGLFFFFIVLLCRFGLRLCAAKDRSSITTRSAMSSARTNDRTTSVGGNRGIVPNIERVANPVTSTRAVLIPIDDDRSLENANFSNNDLAAGKDNSVPSTWDVKPPEYWETFLDDEANPPPTYDEAAKKDKETLVQIV